MTQEIKTRQCPGCKIVLPYQEDVEHLQTVAFGRYGVASPECLALLNKVFLKEYECGRPTQARLDAYGVQHPPHEEIQKKLGINPRLVAASKQSVAIHLVTLYLMVEKKMNYNDAGHGMKRVIESGIALENEELMPPANLGNITVADVAQATTCEEHVRLVNEWSKSAWQAWANYHDTVRGWYEKYGK